MKRSHKEAALPSPLTYKYKVASALHWRFGWAWARAWKFVNAAPSTSGRTPEEDIIVRFKNVFTQTKNEVLMIRELMLISFPAQLTGSVKNSIRYGAPLFNFEMQLIYQKDATYLTRYGVSPSNCETIARALGQTIDPMRKQYAITYWLVAKRGGKARADDVHAFLRTAGSSRDEIDVPWDEYCPYPEEIDKHELGKKARDLRKKKKKPKLTPSDALKRAFKHLDNEIEIWTDEKTGKEYYYSRETLKAERRIAETVVKMLSKS